MPTISERYAKLLEDMSGFASRFGVSPGVGGAPANITYAQPGRTNPQTVPLIPGVPGFILAPGDRPLSSEESRHEGTHAALGLPGAVAGVLGAELMGVGEQGSYLAPDEVLAYLSQPSSEDTEGDVGTITQIADALKRQGQGVGVYLDAVKAAGKYRNNLADLLGG